MWFAFEDLQEIVHLYQYGPYEHIYFTPFLARMARRVKQPWDLSSLKPKYVFSWAYFNEYLKALKKCLKNLYH